MKPKQLVFLFLALALLDDLLALAFPVNFEYQGYSFIPHFCFVALMLSVYEMKLLDRVLICGLCGLLTDMFMTNSFMFYFFVYMASGALIGLFSRFMNRDARVCFFVCLSMVFLIDFVPMLINVWLGKLHVSLSTWLLHHELLTLMIHVAAILVLMYSLDVFERFQTIRTHRKKLQERRRFTKLKTQNKKRQVI